MDFTKHYFLFNLAIYFDCSRSSSISLILVLTDTVSDIKLLESCKCDFLSLCDHAC